MSSKFTTVCLMTTALTIAPALAQNSDTQDKSAPDTTAAAHASQSIDTQSFVTKAAEGGVFEIKSSQLALKKSQDKDVQAFAHRMISDHTKADDQLKSIATKETIPTSPDAQQTQMLSQLQGETGSKFVSDFKTMQVEAHKQTIGMFESYASSGDNKQIKQFAEQTLPTLKDHLRMAQDLAVPNNAGETSQQTAENKNAGDRNYITQETPGTWRASKMIGLGVYNDQNQEVGDINDILFNKSGKIDAVVIGVGGFLGMGERNVAVPYDDLKWSMTSPGTTHAASGNATSTPLAGQSAVTPAAGNGSGTAAGTDVKMATSDNKPASYPDHAILPDASKDQLKQAPQFSYASAPM